MCWQLELTSTPLPAGASHHTHRLRLCRVADSAHRDKFTALHFAVVNGHIDMLLCLLDAGADCSARDGCAVTCGSCVLVAG